jgi:hypothetical protein
MRKPGFIFFLSFFFLMTGCVSFRANRVPLILDRPKECQAFLTALDEQVEKAGVRDAANYPVPGFPYLRTSRFLSRLKDSIHSEQEKDQWTRWMRMLDIESRRKEISNLPDAMASSLSFKQGKPFSREQFYEQVESCSEALFQHDKARPDFYETLIPFVEAPDEYSLALRIFGLYPLAAIPVTVATDMSRKKIRSWFETSLENLPVDGRLRAFVPSESSPLGDNELQAIMNASKENFQGLPLPDQDQGKRLVRHFAPVFIQDVAASYDQIGRIAWRGDCPDVDQTTPTVYYYFSNAFLKGKPILQINYVIWYSERAGKRTPWMERGRLDGLTLRVSLDEMGKPFMVDTVSDCGCYHLYAPEKERVAQILSTPLKFDPFVPQWLPGVSHNDRLGVRLNSGWHQVQRIIAAKEFPDPTRYELMPYDILEVLPRKGDQTESIFNSKGIAKCSKRIERYILFSMGLPKIGSMRQRGHQAIELIGRAQFDDPDLFDRNFIFK